jgi:glycosyltransferase involved in cell wall biosynthesis
VINSLAVIGSLAKSAGGPTYSVTALSEALAKENVQRFLFYIKVKSDNEIVLPKGDLVEAIELAGKEFNWLGIRWSGQVEVELDKIIRRENIELLHNHGLWLPINHKIAVCSRRNKLPLVITTHGMLTLWSFNYHKLKKQLAWWLYQRNDIEKCSAVHVTSQSEVDDLRQIGYKGPAALIPLGLDLPELRNVPKDPDRIRTALFVSRIHPKKGLLNLVEAWSIVRPKGWRVVIAGPDQMNHEAELKKTVREKGIEKDFVFKGPIYGDEKWDLYWNSDLFILPTYSENFGIVVPEAMACGLPVITTYGTPWEELNTKSAGWWVPIGVEPLVTALRQAVEMNDDERSAMGMRGRKVVEENYQWNTAAIKMRKLYEWILGRGPKPEYVFVNGEKR